MTMKKMMLAVKSDGMDLHHKKMKWKIETCSKAMIFNLYYYYYYYYYYLFIFDFYCSLLFYYQSPDDFDDDNNDDPNFWPSEDEFKDLLIGSNNNNNNYNYNNDYNIQMKVSSAQKLQEIGYHHMFEVLF